MQGRHAPGRPGQRAVERRDAIPDDTVRAVIPCSPATLAQRRQVLIFRTKVAHNTLRGLHRLSMTVVLRGFAAVMPWPIGP